MKLEDQYLKFVRWEEPDGLYVGYCPDLFLGGVCHGRDQTVVYAELCELVAGEIHDLAHEGRPPPPPHTRPMQELELAAI